MDCNIKGLAHRRKAGLRAARILLGLSLAAFVTPAGAATQGTLGTTSQGSITITATVPNRAQITGLTDINFTNADPTTTATATQNDCVWSNTATKGYSIKATGSGTAGAFTLASGALTPIAYSVQWNQSSGQSSGTSLTAGTALSGLVSTATTPTCSSGPATTSSLIVSIASADLQNMVAATSYTGTLTLLVTPQ
ncbi:hypothetical protein SAMIE_1002620 [Sphingobium amiense]|uniref:Spore coat protein U domain-containing protein n=1 Tax=Sphingobium amiense TaxID=135719 RepID=A0A494VY36_9SPHN|nr:hypothetical protein [Sphingobium amiense]BBD96761.1 hypothetical protein SAMIE_1002620 [Sphingobium amiense]